MTATDLVQIALVAFGGAGAAATAVAVLTKMLIEHRLTKDLKAFESTIEQRLAKEMKVFEANLAADVRLVELKLPIYRSLWELSSAFQSSQHTEYSEEYLAKTEESLRSWYYKNGAGALLSFAAQNYLQAGLQLLRAGRQSDHRVIRQVFSGLRTQLKLDLGVYSPREAAAALDTQEVIAQAKRNAARAPG